MKKQKLKEEMKRIESQRIGEKWSKDKMRGEKQLREGEGKEKNYRVLEEQSRDQMTGQWRRRGV